MESFRFKAHIEFLAFEEGGRRWPASQGYRPDFFYEGERKSGYMIWPRFLDEEGEEFPDDSEVPKEVDAMMYILDSELAKSIHSKRIQPGVKFTVNEGSRVLARGIVLSDLEVYKS